jgi:hypothetical protein
MATIFTKDSLRASVEANSGGKVTVLYNEKGHPGYYVRIPAFRLEDIDADLGSGLHPAFIVNGTQQSELLYGMYPAAIKDGCGLPLPGVDPATYVTYDQAQAYCTANGPGFHLSTMHEWSAFKMWCMKNGFQPRGNTNYGRHHDQKHETGVRQDGGVPGVTSGSARTLTGSGPMSWRHDNSPFGVSDLVGNVNEWQGLLKIVDGRIYTTPDNRFDTPEEDWVAQDAYFDSTAAGDENSSGDIGDPILSDGVTKHAGPAGSDEYFAYTQLSAWSSLTLKDGYTPPDIVKQLGISPAISGDAASNIAVYSGILGFLYVRNYGTRFPVCGGYWLNTSNAGLAALSLNCARSYSSLNIGFRPAFVA